LGISGARVWFFPGCAPSPSDLRPASAHTIVISTSSHKGVTDGVFCRGPRALTYMMSMAVQHLQIHRSHSRNALPLTKAQLLRETTSKNTPNWHSSSAERPAQRGGLGCPTLGASSSLKCDFGDFMIQAVYTSVRAALASASRTLPVQQPRAHWAAAAHTKGLPACAPSTPPPSDTPLSTSGGLRQACAGARAAR